ncbi:SPASM domain-containing protein [candidate division KSB1 bacterium]|nr:SPASM domain-containing protein [candidate division KSB1 bacterium]MBL7093925.1 SPASM domain-containing protein [candidate division KSB1 bacterium]
MKEIFWISVFKAATFRKTINSLKVITSLFLSKILKQNFVWGTPFIINIEPTVVCNLKCPQCITGMGKIKRDSSFLSYKLYKQILDELGNNLWYLLLYNQGEPFLHKEFIELIELAKQKRIYVTTSTNGHFFEREVAVERLVKSGLDSIIISLDGADENTYQKYRHNGDFKKVIKGIKLLAYCKKKLKSKTPKILIQFLVMKHNEQQLVKIKRLIKKLGADRLLIKTFQIEDKNKALSFLPSNKKINRYKNGTKKLNLKNSASKGCARLWYSTVILSDGRVVPCCFDKNGEYSFGKIKDKSLKEIWTSDEYKNFRSQISRNRGFFEICRNCTQNQKIFF